MKTFFFVCFVLAISLQCHAQESDASKAASKQKMESETNLLQDMTEEEVMLKWLETIALSDEHKILAKDVGNYTYVSTMWTQPGAEPMVSKGTTTVESLMDGRYFIEKHTSNMMGMPYHGMGINGYDKIENEYVFTWIDNMGTGIMKFTGNIDEEGRMVATTNAINPMTRQEEVHRVVTTKNKEGHQMDYYVSAGAGSEEFHSMEIVYKKIND